MKEIYWKVPHFQQERSMTCGLACARMLLAFYGINMTEEEILKEVFMHKSGSWYSDLARLFIKKGLKASIYTINLHIFSPFWTGLDEEQLSEKLLEREEKLKGLLKTEVKRLLKYLKMGGLLKVKIPEVKMLSVLLKRQPIMIPVSRSLIYPDRIDDLGHYLVVNGFDGKDYTVLDPGRRQVFGSEFKVKKEILEYAWLANNRDSDGYLMEIIN